MTWCERFKERNRIFKNHISQHGFIEGMKIDMQYAKAELKKIKLDHAEDMEIIEKEQNEKIEKAQKTGNYGEAVFGEKIQSFFENRYFRIILKIILWGLGISLCALAFFYVTVIYIFIFFIGLALIMKFIF